MISPQTKIRVFIYTSFKIVQESLQILIESHADLIVAETASHSKELLEKTKLVNPDVVLIYLIDGNTETVEIISEILEFVPKTKIILVAAATDYASQTRAIRLGAVGIVQKNQSSKMLLDAIKRTYHGETWINQSLLLKLLRSNNKKNGQKSKNLPKAQTLTVREKEIINLICRGYRNKDISIKLGISEATVRHHLSSIYSKTGAEDRLNLVIHAHRRNLMKQLGDSSIN